MVRSTATLAGQAQKENYVNESVTRIDALLHGAIESESGTPPASPVDGLCWLVGASPTGEWAGQTGKIAARQAGNWLFFAPIDGMKLLNRSTGQEIRFKAGWQIAARPAAPAGGGTVDAQARSAIDEILASLTVAGIIPPS